MTYKLEPMGRWRCVHNWQHLSFAIFVFVFFDSFCVESDAEPLRLPLLMHREISFGVVFRCILVCLSLALCAAATLAASIVPRQASINAGDDNYTLAAEFDIDLGQRLEDAVMHGIPLYFELEVVLERERKYWVNEHIVTRTLNYRLSYSSLTRQYRLAHVAADASVGSLYQTFGSLADALRAMAHLKNLPLIESRAMRPGEIYQASLRLSLDRSQLPKPFQLDAMTDADWDVTAKSRHWEFVAAEPAAKAATGNGP